MQTDEQTSTDKPTPEKADAPAPEIITYRMVGDMAPLFAAKAQARLAFKPIVKNREVEVQPKKREDGSWPAKYTFTYATLDSVRDSCDEALASNGLDIWHLPCTGLDARELHTFLTHSSGAFIEAVLLIPDVKNWQDFGSAMTYAQRYSYQALAGVASEHDDDGNAADGNAVQNSKPRDRSKPPEPPKRNGQAKNGSSVQSSSKPAEAPKPAQDEPEPAKAPEPQPEPKTPPAAATGERRGLSQDQLQKLGGLLKDPARKWNRAQIDLLLAGLFNKGHAELTSVDGDQVIAVLEQAARADYQADQLLSMMQEFSTPDQPNPEAVIKALDAEGTAFP